MHKYENITTKQVCFKYVYGYPKHHTNYKAVLLGTIGLFHLITVPPPPPPYQGPMFFNTPEEFQSLQLTLKNSYLILNTPEEISCYP